MQNQAFLTTMCLLPPSNAGFWTEEENLQYDSIQKKKKKQRRDYKSQNIRTEKAVVVMKKVWKEDTWIPEADVSLINHSQLVAELWSEFKSSEFSLNLGSGRASQVAPMQET